MAEAPWFRRTHIPDILRELSELPPTIASAPPWPSRPFRTRIATSQPCVSRLIRRTETRVILWPASFQAESDNSRPRPKHYLCMLVRDNFRTLGPCLARRGEAIATSQCSQFVAKAADGRKQRRMLADFSSRRNSKGVYGFGRLWTVAGRCAVQLEMWCPASPLTALGIKCTLLKLRGTAPAL
jgi:hypothetical protein